MGTSVGEIGLDLVVNQSPFNRQMNGITGLAKKAGVALAGAFAIRKLVEFGRSCIDLGSDLAEVQNVVDVTFPHMSAQVDKFAKDAAMSFGLSETMAKKYTGTFGAMAKAFGFSESAAYDMGSALTGLAGDVASFYNLSQDEAYTKLKSVFTGETESLKDLGVVMTQTALDSYAMANGYGKVTAKMSEAEKVALRYAFVQDQLALASGDFARTSDSWANQVKILTLQFDSLKATIGQGLINLFTPIIKMINVVIGKLAILANAFKAFTELITGKRSKDAAAGTKAVADAAGSAANGYNNATDAAGNMAGATADAGKAAKKAAKEIKSLMGFDQINRLEEADSDSGSGGAGGAAIDFGSLAEGETILDETDGKMQALIEKAKELASLFKQGFTIGLGDTSVIDSIKRNIASIGESLKDIFTDSQVQNAADGFGKRFAKSCGKGAGALASVGLTIADNIIGGLSTYLSNNSDQIKKHIISMFDISGDTAEISADFAVALADVFSVFRSDSAKKIAGDIIGIFADSFMGAAELTAKKGRDLLDLLTAPFIENKDKIKTAIQGMLDASVPIFESLKETTDHLFDGFNKAYDEHVKPMVDSLKTGFSEICSTILDSHNQYIQPILQSFGSKFKDTMTKHIQPAIDKFVELIGSAADCIKVLWENILQPFINWSKKTILSTIAPVLEAMGDIFLNVFGVIGDVVGDIMDVLGGLLDFITGIFSGDWEKAWNGIKQYFSSNVQAFKDLFSGVKQHFSIILKGIEKYFTNALKVIKNQFAPIGKWFSQRWEDIKSVFKNVASWFGSKFTSALSGIKAVFNPIKEWFSSVWNSLKTTVSNTWDSILKLFQKGGKIFSGVKDGIAGVFKTIVNSMITGINKVIATPFHTINKLLNKIRNIGIGDIKPFSGLWDENPLPVPQIPKLASGGFVRANTPQLAMIGDNRHQGEVVAPEDKMREMAVQAAQIAAQDMAAVLDRAMAGNGGKETTLTVNVSISEKTLVKAILELNGRQNRLGGIIDTKI